MYGNEWEEIFSLDVKEYWMLFESSVFLSRVGEVGIYFDGNKEFLTVLKVYLKVVWVICWDDFFCCIIKLEFDLGMIWG